MFLAISLNKKTLKSQKLRLRKKITGALSFMDHQYKKEMEMSVFLIKFALASIMAWTSFNITEKQRESEPCFSTYVL